MLWRSRPGADVIPLNLFASPAFGRRNRHQRIQRGRGHGVIACRQCLGVGYEIRRRPAGASGGKSLGRRAVGTVAPALFISAESRQSGIGLQSPPHHVSTQRLGPASSAGPFYSQAARPAPLTASNSAPALFRRHLSHDHEVHASQRDSGARLMIAVVRRVANNLDDDAARLGPRPNRLAQASLLFLHP